MIVYCTHDPKFLPAIWQVGPNFYLPFQIFRWFLAGKNHKKPRLIRKKRERYWFFALIHTLEMPVLVFCLGQYGCHLTPNPKLLVVI